MYVYNDISLNVSLIRKHTVIKVERVDEWNLKRRACTVKDQRPSSKKMLRRWWKSRTSLERISIQIIKAVKLTGELNWAEFLKRLTFHDGCWKDLACLQNCKGLYGKNAGRQSMRMQSNNFLHSVRIYTCKLLWARVFFSRVRLAASVSATGRSHASDQKTWPKPRKPPMKSLWHPG